MRVHLKVISVFKVFAISLKVCLTLVGFLFERIQHPPVLPGTSRPSAAADVSCDVGSCPPAKHKALWEVGGVCVHGNWRGPWVDEQTRREASFAWPESKSKFYWLIKFSYVSFMLSVNEELQMQPKS